MVIDSSRAVQALAASALQKHGYRIEVLGEGGKALETIRLLQPTVVIVGDDVEGLDSIGLCSAIRSDAEVADTYITVLISGHDDDSRFSEEVISAGADRVLKKPFKSAELTEAVSTLLTLPRGRTEVSKLPIAFLGEDGLLSAMLKALFEKQNQDFQLFSDPMELLTHSQGSPLSACIIQRENASDLSWHQDEDMGCLLVVTSSDDDISELLLPPNTKVLTRPLTVSKLEEALSIRFNYIASSVDNESAPPLTTSGQSELAANISAGVYRFLLQHEGLQKRAWSEVSEEVAQEVLNICKAVAQ